MSRISTLSLVLATALAGACSNSSPSPRGGSLDSPTDRVASPDHGDDEERFSYTEYPDHAVSDDGPRGKAKGGTLIAANGDASFDLAKAWESGPAVLVFYRGHW